jgi:flavin reductase (DIM6/NTAB) family NADH-FMN oxidoreductase RutF
MPETALREATWDDVITLTSPHPYVLAVTVDAAGKPDAIGLGWWTFCSGSPRMLAISVGKPRYSRECLDHCREFVLCLLPEQHAHAAWVCGTKSGRKLDKLAAAGLTVEPSLKVKVPTIAESVASFECRVVSELETGDHILYVGEVVAMRAVPGTPRHLYSLHYRKLVGIGADGSVNLELEQ